jgi:predicted dehydrogenase
MLVRGAPPTGRQHEESDMTKRTSGAVRVGILGLGRAGWNMHCAALREMPCKFRIVAACDHLAERREEAAEAFGCRTYEHAKELIADDEVELVDVASRSMDHYRHAMLGLKAGKHVYVEKPMCLTYFEAKRMQAAADRYPGRLFVGHNRRFDPDFLHVRELLKSGVIGEPYQIKLTRASFQRRDDWQTLLEFGGGQLLNWGPHVIDHALRLLDAPVAEMWSDLKRIAAAGDAEDHVKIILKAENDRVAEIDISGGTAIGEPAYVVRGTRGALTCDGRTITLRHLDPKTTWGRHRARSATPERRYGSSVKLKWVEKTIPVKPKRRPDIWAEVYKALRRGARFPITVEQAVEVERIIHLARKGTPFARTARRTKKTRSGRC